MVQGATQAFNIKCQKSPKDFGEGSNCCLLDDVTLAIPINSNQGMPRSFPPAATKKIKIKVRKVLPAEKKFTAFQSCCYSPILFQLLFLCLCMFTTGVSHYHWRSSDSKNLQHLPQYSSNSYQFGQFGFFFISPLFPIFYQILGNSWKCHNNNKHMSVTFIRYSIDSCPILHFLSILLCHLPRQQNPLRSFLLSYDIYISGF